jgi:hypothetical protein
MNLPAKHIEFIRLFVDGQTQANAYKLSIGKKGVSKQVCEVKGSQLAKKYAELIAQERKKLSDIVEQANQSKVAEIAEMDIMSKSERMQLLSKMARGEIKIKQPFVVNGKIMEYPAELSATERRGAIAEINKMVGDYAPSKTETTLKLGKDLADEDYV